METNRHALSPVPGFDSQIAALLDRANESSSIFDRVMDLPQADPEQSEWDRAVMRRLELRLSRSLRDLLEGEPERKSA